MSKHTNNTTYYMRESSIPARYTLYRNHKPITHFYGPLKVIILRSCGTLFKHGSISQIDKYLLGVQRNLFGENKGRSLSYVWENMISIVLPDELPLEEINLCLASSGYIAEMLKKYSFDVEGLCMKIPLNN